VISCVLFIIADIFADWFVKQKTIHYIFKILIYWLPEKSKNVYEYSIEHHVRASGVLLLMLIPYFFSYKVFKPDVKTKKQAPALFYGLLMIITLGLVLGAMTFFLDLYRIPALIVLLLFSIMLYYFFGGDHYHEVYPSSSFDETDTNELAKALNERTDRGKGMKKNLVMISTWGGGIQAAGWTTTVLRGLIEKLGQPFLDSIGVVSGASGGSVGLLHFLDYLVCKSRSPNNSPQDEDGLKNMVSNSVQDSLDSTGWGFAYPDIWRLFGLSFFVPKLLDRGWAIETDWKSNMICKDTTMSDLRKLCLDGEIPLPILNTTRVNDGNRVMLTPLSFNKGKSAKNESKNGMKCPDPDNENPYSSEDFISLYEKYDMHIATAARLSATFPFVSPISRSIIAKEIETGKCKLEEKKELGKQYMADGGYYDNSGIASCLEWLDKILENENHGIKKIFFIEIKPYPEQVQCKEEDNTFGTFLPLLGPLLTLYNFWDTIQGVRSTLDLWRIKNYLKEAKNIEVLHYLIQFPHSDDKYKPPLTWRLSAKEIKRLEDSWCKLLKNPKSCVRKLIDDWVKTMP